MKNVLYLFIVKYFNNFTTMCLGLFFLDFSLRKENNFAQYLYNCSLVFVFIKKGLIMMYDEFILI